MMPGTTQPDPGIALALIATEDFAAWLAARPAPQQRWIAAQNFRGERHQVLLLPDAQGEPLLAVAGIGSRRAVLSLWDAAAIAERLPPRRYLLQESLNARDATQVYLGFLYASYRFNRYRGASPAPCAQLMPPPAADTVYASLAAEALSLARDWINTPAADFGPVELASAVQALAARHGGTYRQWCGEELLRDNFPAIHAVGRASPIAPRLCELHWAPATPADLPQLVLVGKGVCFDSGGLDIKPGAAMALMKKDMGGAAVALALAHMLISAGIRADVRVLIPAVENAIGSRAYRPGDVLRTRKGLTVEVGNTDAEGRLVLCDALALADGPDVDLLIDFATLTGAARVALGPELPALFGTDAAMVTELAAIAAAENDPLWPMPLWDPYDEELGSRIADLNNVASSGFAGAIFGALFLRRFVTATPRWLHLDLYAWNPRERPGRSLGAEAQGVRALFRFLVQRYGIA